MIGGYAFSVLMLLAAYFVHAYMKKKNKAEGGDMNATERMNARREEVAQKLKLEKENMFASVLDDYTIVSVSMEEHTMKTESNVTTIKSKNRKPALKISPIKPRQKSLI